MTQRYLTYYAGLADKLEGRQIPLGDGYVDYTTHEPLRVSGPDRAVERPAASRRAVDRMRLVTGNTVVLKSPEDSPLSLFLLAEACERAGVPPVPLTSSAAMGPRRGCFGLPSRH